MVSEKAHSWKTTPLFNTGFCMVREGRPAHRSTQTPLPLGPRHLTPCPTQPEAAPSSSQHRGTQETETGERPRSERRRCWNSLWWNGRANSIPEDPARPHPLAGGFCQTVICPSLARRGRACGYSEQQKEERSPACAGVVSFLSAPSVPYPSNRCVR